MKKIILLIITLFLSAQTIKAQTVVLDANGVTVKWTGTTVPSPYFVQASPRGTLEWFAIVNNSTKSNITPYAKNIQSGINYFKPPSSSTPIPFNNIVTTLATDMNGLFSFADTFNEPIDSWDVSNVGNKNEMFKYASSFNQPIGSWNVGNVTTMFSMFRNANAFNQPIGSWNVGNVTSMYEMFREATSFNQPIGSWNVSNVINMTTMFSNAFAFNQPIGSWNVGNVTSMNTMFSGAFAFNQPIGSWNVTNVTNMNSMFSGTAFNQNIGSWNVSNVAYMATIFTGAELSTTNYDALLIGWSTITPPETPLKPNVVFDAGTSKYCNGASALDILILAPNNWIITDGGLDCTSLDTETFDTVALKLYPNPVLNILNVKVDSNLINQPYDVVDGLGRVILNGNINDVDTVINVEQLSKGVYYLKVSDNNASKFVKE